MAVKPLPQRRDFAGERTADRADQSREDLAQALRACPFISGKLVSVTFAAGVRKVVRHGLGVPAACIVIRQNYFTVSDYANMSESTDQVTGMSITQQLALFCEVDAKLDLWFYARASKPIDAGQKQSL